MQPKYPMEGNGFPPGGNPNLLPHLHFCICVGTKELGLGGGGGMGCSCGELTEAEGVEMKGGTYFQFEF